MILGSCHCGVITYEIDEEPQWLTECNCSFCSKAGALWFHADRNNVTVKYEPESVVRYVWGDKTIAFISCKSCGGTTHCESLRPEEHTRMALNVRMASSSSFEDIRVRHFDGADTFQFID